jgi:radical SAM protein with 4Fe4S-binding SPASM domain
MQESRDESNRISRLSTKEAQEYLKKIKGKAYEEYRKDWEKCGRTQIGLGYPLQLNIELTSHCNLRCSMCYRNYGIDVRHGQIDFEDIKCLANQFSQMNTPSLWLSGGEPLIHPQIEQILKILGETNPVDFWMVSNGLLLSEHLSEIIIDCSITWLSISIDASNEDTYKRIRGGDYNLLVKNVERFLEIRKAKGSCLPFLRVSFIKMDDNEGEEQAFTERWKDKADIIDFQTLADYHDLDNFTEMDVREAEYRCTAPFRLVSVIPNGDIIPCCNGFYGEKSAFNIHNFSLDEYWSSEFHVQFSKSIKNKNYCNECIKCIKSFLPRKR